MLGMPLGRLRRPLPGLRVFLNATAVGVLLFLFWDVLSAAWGPIDEALAAAHAGKAGLGGVIGYGVLFVAGLAVGLLGLVGYDRCMARPVRGNGGPGAMALSDVRRGTWSPARRMSLLIAVGIGLHNFAEGLAIGQAAAAGAIALSTVLVIGFALHNATEGFGIVAPLAAETGEGAARPGWGFLLGMAAIGGGPTFVGAAVGHGFSSPGVSIAFLTLAAGSIAFVIVQLLGVTARARRNDLVAYGVLLGLLAGFATDAVVSAGGA